MNNRREAGFTFLELIIATALAIILAAAALVWLNPAQQFASARNTRRSADLGAIANAVGQNIADNRGVFICASGAIPTAAATKMASSTGSYNIAPCLVPAYLASLPYDPTAAGAYFASTSDYNTGYTIVASGTTGMITFAAPSAELGAAITVTR